MRAIAEFIAGLLVLALLSIAGTLAATRFGLPVPGPILGLLVYTALLFMGFLDWTMPAASRLSGLLGAMIVPALVGVAAFTTVLLHGGWRLAVALIAGVVVTGVVTGATYRMAA